MSKRKQFGAFDGVFTPSILTILGVIMYLRLGWVVGSAGLVGAIAIIVIAHIISVSTGLSISSIATDKKVGAGGVYYVLSRSLGLPIGGAIGLTLFVGTAFSIALYLIGFGESFNAYLGLGTSINDLRISGSIALLVLTIIAFISTSVAIKTQFFIMAAIAISLVSVFLGHGSGGTFQVPFFGSGAGASLDVVFAIFFPAVTGFTAGIAMSGDLKDPKKAIPRGTISAIAVGFIIYIVLAIYLAYTVSPEDLLSNNNILMKIALFAPAVVAGIWGATLSSAMGGILGGPRILQALSVDKVTPVIFGKGHGLGNEPRNALILAVLIAEAGILIGELDIIARLVSMFYLAAYGFINLSFFLESWVGTDFKPSFKVSKWIGLIGFITTFGVMFKLDFLAMIAAFLLIGGIYFWLTRKQIALGTGDIWQSVWQSVIKSGLKRMEATEEHKRNWKPNIMLFSGNSESRPHLLEFSKALAGQAGMVTNFDLVENKEAKVLFPKHKQSVSDEMLQHYGIFGRQVEVSNVFKGIETIATTFGFTGLDPNTVLMGWARNTTDPIWFAQMTRKLIDLDFNVLYLDYDKRWGFRNKRQIDLWWRGISNNAELMLHLAKFIQTTPDWRNAEIRIILVNDYNVDRRVIESRIQQLLDEFRVYAEISVINNEVERKPFYDLMKVVSAESDLILIGIPDIKKGDEETFVARTNELVNIIGTTLLVKASSTFEVTHLGIRDMESGLTETTSVDKAIEALKLNGEAWVDTEISSLDEQWKEAARVFRVETLSVISKQYGHFSDEVEAVLDDIFKRAAKREKTNAEDLLRSGTEKLAKISEKFRTEDIRALGIILAEGLQVYKGTRAKILESRLRVLRGTVSDEGGTRNIRIRYRSALEYYQKAYGDKSLHFSMLRFGGLSAEFLVAYEKLFRSVLLRLSRAWHADPDKFAPTLSKIRREAGSELKALRERQERLALTPVNILRKSDRKALAELAEKITERHLSRTLSKNARALDEKQRKSRVIWVRDFPEFWVRNQKMFHLRMETDLRLDRSLVLLHSSRKDITERLRDTLFDPLCIKIEGLLESLGNIDAKHLTGADSELFVIEEESYDPGPVIQEIQDRVRNVNFGIPEEIELIAEESVQGITEIQGTGVRTVRISLIRIADYLVQTNFEVPLLEKTNALIRQMRQMNGEVFNTAGLINYLIDTALEEKDQSQLKDSLAQTATTLKQSLETARINFQGFEAETNDRLELTATSLHVGYITGQSDELAQYIRKVRQRRGLFLWRTQANEFVRARQRKLLDFIDLKKENVARAGFDLKQATVRSDQEILRGLVAGISSSAETTAALPYYYRQLFSGKHLNLGKAPEYRAREISEVRNALNDIGNGLPGAILICGESMNGKSYLADYAARYIIGKPVYRLIAPAGGAWDISDLQRSFQQATERKGNAATILKNTRESSTFLIDDIELWWTRAEGGQEVINHLCDLILRFASTHSFLLTANIHTLELIRRSSRLDSAVSSVVAMGSSGVHVMSKVIWTRHRTGSVPVSYRDVDSSQLNEHSIRKWVGKAFDISSGKIGYGLQLWLNSLESREGNEIVLRELQMPVYPELKDQSLYYVMLQFYTHRSLSRRRLERIFSGESISWLDSVLLELRKGRVIETPVRDVYILRTAVRPFIENWLKEREML